MKQPVLVIMAAGLGSRFGGLKQMTPIDRAGHVIIDYSIYDAKRAGFNEVICIIKKELEDEFEEVIGHRIRKHIKLVYAYQSLDMIPCGFTLPEGRTKPLGTSHAVLCAAKEIAGRPFAVINADDFYGADAFKTIYGYLTAEHGPNEYAMVGYLVKNTLSPNGSVSRGVCEVDEQGMLVRVVERLKIYPDEGGAKFTEDEGVTFTHIDGDTIVSMNFFGYMPGFLDELEKRFPKFLAEQLPLNPPKAEYLLPRTTNELVTEGIATLEVLHSADSWYGITNREDLPEIMAALENMKLAGKYPEELWA